MTSGKQLFLFSGEFPYGFSESFLETELNYLAQEFERITILPLEGQGRKRELPTNVTVLKPIDGADSKILKLLKGLFNFAPISSGSFRELFRSFKYGKRGVWSFFSTFCRARRVFKNHDFQEAIRSDSILYFYWARNTAVVLSIPFKSSSKIVSRYHGFDLFLDRNAGYIPFREQVFNSLDKAINISQQGKYYLAELYPKCQNRCYSFPLGVYTQGKSKASQDGTFRIVTCSNDSKVKRLHLLAEALSDLDDANVKWTHIGGGDYCACLDLLKNSNAQFELKGQLSNSEVNQFYLDNPVDLFVNVSSSEGLPVSIMEALSAGIPIMATNVGGVSEIVTDELGCLLKPDLTAQELTEQIVLFKNSTQHHEMREKAFAMWQKKCNADKNYLEFSKFLASLT